jgi:gluconate 2-dehydrogenase gamma chain
MILANEDEKDPSGEPGVKQHSRRRFLINSGYVIGGAVLGGAIGTLIKNPPQSGAPSPGASPSPSAGAVNYNRALMFLTQEQFSTLEPAVERIFPTDEHGPGAKDLGVAYFVDHQLAGEWGTNGREYMSAPFFAGEKVQGYQGRLRRREMFEIGLREMENYSLSKFNKGFSELSGEQQDSVLSAFEKDEIKLTTISPSGFFRLLRGGTIEGTYSDPVYGGNMDMNGWRMREFPGNKMSFTNVIDKEFTRLEPSSLRDHMAGH